MVSDEGGVLTLEMIENALGCVEDNPPPQSSSIPLSSTTWEVYQGILGWTEEKMNSVFVKTYYLHA